MTQWVALHTWAYRQHNGNPRVTEPIERGHEDAGREAGPGLGGVKGRYWDEYDESRS